MKRSFSYYGDFSFTVPDIKGYMELLVPDNIIMLDKDGARSGRILKVLPSESNGNSITVSGYHLDGLTCERINKPTDNDAIAVLNYGYDSVPQIVSDDQIKNGISPVSAETIVKTYVDRHMVSAEDPKRRFELLRIEPDKHRGNLTVKSASLGTVLADTLKEVCEDNNIGYQISADPLNKRMLFSVICQTDHSKNQYKNRQIVFGKKYKNLSNASHTVSIEGYKNIGYGAGETFENGLREMMAYGIDEEIAKGFDRHEVFVDCGSLSSAESDTSMSIKDEVLNNLKSNKKTNSLSGTVVPDGPFCYLRDFNLGDIVTVEMSDFGIEADLPITEVEEIYEPQNITITPTFGTPMDAGIRLMQVIKTKGVR